MKTVREILEELNVLDEHARLEAKSCGNALGESFFESVCGFSNEPDCDGGTLVLGVSRVEDDFFSAYEVCGVSQVDKITNDIITGCAERYNHPVRPEIESEEYEGKVVVKVRIAELSPAQKPLYFKKKGLPQGAYRRTASGDVKCNEDDLALFFGGRSKERFELTMVAGTSLRDIDPEAIAHYRKLSLKVKPESEIRDWEDEELLEAVSAVKWEKGGLQPTLLGLLLFGTRQAYRRELPTVKIDYIRVPSNEWVANPAERFTSTNDIRGPLLQTVERAVVAIMDDLPKGFSLADGQIQADTPTLPSQVIREAVVNAVMHRSYREHRPTQIIRYTNRVEISNAGYSLKNEDRLGQPGSELRNPSLSEVFFETNTAERKGSGIRVMRKMMVAAGFSPPTFESNRDDNTFTIRFLLQHFLNQSDLEWLARIRKDLSENQKVALIFLREQRAIDNRSLRQLTDCDILQASQELRKLRDMKLVILKGKGTATYYVPGLLFPEHGSENESHGSESERHGSESERHGSESEAEQVPMSAELVAELELITKQSRGGDVVRVVLQLCAWRTLTAAEIASYLKRTDTKALKRNYLSDLISQEKLSYLYPDMEKHPNQAYLVPKK